jgi:hypothetical protein
MFSPECNKTFLYILPISIKVKLSNKY